MATAAEDTLNLSRLNMNIFPPKNDNTFGGETDLSSQSRQHEAQHVHEASLSNTSLENVDEDEDGESDTPYVAEAHTSQNSSASSIATGFIDEQKVSLDKTEPIKETLSSSGDNHSHNQHGKHRSKYSKTRKKSNSNGLITWKTETVGEESKESSTCSTLLTNGSNHSEATVGRRNCSAPEARDRESNKDKGNRSSTIVMNGVCEDDDKPTQAQHQRSNLEVEVPVDDQHSNRKLKKSNSVRFRDHDSDDGQDNHTKIDISIREEEIEVEPSNNGDHSEASEGSMFFPGIPNPNHKRKAGNKCNHDSSSQNLEICNDSSSEAGSIDILESSLPMLDSSMHQANRNKSPINLTRMNVTKSHRMWCQNASNKLRLICGKIINQKYVQQFIVAMIMANALMMGLGTFDFVYENPPVKSAFDTADLAFLIIFTVESTMQLIFHGLALFKDGWLTFDFLIVILSWCFATLQVFRTMRTLRLIARIQILRRLCQALVEAVPRLSGILCLFLLIMYIYAVMATVLFGDMYERGLTDLDYFSRLDITLFTLFQMITLDWASIVRQVMVVYPFAWAVFTTYLSFTSFVLFSLIIGVVCDAVSATEHDADLVEALERKEDAQERILRLQQRVNYLQKQQKSVLASVQTVLEEIRADSEPYAPGQVSAINASNGLRSSNKSKRSSGKSTTSKSSTRSAGSYRSSGKATDLRSSATSAASLRVATPIDSEYFSASEEGFDSDSFCGE